MATRTKTHKLEIPTQKGVFLALSLKAFNRDARDLNVETMQDVKLGPLEDPARHRIPVYTFYHWAQRPQGASIEGGFGRRLELDRPTLQVINAWIAGIKERRAFTTEDLRVLRRVYPDRWREILGDFRDPNRSKSFWIARPEYFAVRDRLIADAKQRMDRWGERLPDIPKRATEDDEDKFFNALLTAYNQELSVEEAVAHIEKKVYRGRVLFFPSLVKGSASNYFRTDKGATWMEERALTLLYQESMDEDVEAQGEFYSEVVQHFADRQEQYGPDGLPFAGVEESSSFSKVLFTGIGLAVTLAVLSERQKRGAFPFVDQS